MRSFCTNTILAFTILATVSFTQDTGNQWPEIEWPYDSETHAQVFSWDEDTGELNLISEHVTYIDASHNR